MRIVLTGKTGQVGYQLERSLQGLGDVIALDSKQMNLAEPDAIRKVLRELKPQLIVNPAAYTAVDQAEKEAELAQRINGIAPGIMAEEARALGAAMTGSGSAVFGVFPESMGQKAARQLNKHMRPDRLVLLTRTISRREAERRGGL